MYIIRTVGNWGSQRLLELPPFSLKVWSHEICNLDKILMKNEHFWRRIREQHEVSIKVFAINVYKFTNFNKKRFYFNKR